MNGAHDYARRLKLSLDPVGAVIALLSRVAVGVDVKRVIRACLHTGFAADAPVAVEINYPVIAFEQRGDGADGHARRVLAVITPEHGKESPRVRVFALLYVFHPRAKCAERDFVFGFTRDRTRVTSDAFAVVNYKPIFHVLYV